MQDTNGHIWRNGLDAPLDATAPFPTKVTEKDFRRLRLAIDDAVSAIRKAEACVATFHGDRSALRIVEDWNITIVFATKTRLTDVKPPIIVEPPQIIGKRPVGNYRQVVSAMVFHRHGHAKQPPAVHVAAIHNERLAVLTAIRACPIVLQPRRRGIAVHALHRRDKRAT